MTEIEKKKPKQQKIQPLSIILAGCIMVIIIGIAAWVIIDYTRTQKEGQVIEQELSGETVPIIGIFDVKKRLDANETFRLIDVRAKEDFDQSHIPTAENIPINIFREGGYRQLPIDIDIILLDYGTGCEFCLEAGTILMENDYEHIWRMSAGMEGWTQANFPLVEATDPNNPTNVYKISTIAAKDLEKLLNNEKESANIAIIDVRTENEFKNAHIENAINVPFQNLEKETNNIPRDKRIIVISENGIEGEKAGATLFDLNYFSVINLDGGWSTWTTYQQTIKEQ